MCSKHFIHPDGPTEEHPDPVPASFTPLQVNKMNRKLKPPTPRANPVSKKLLLDATEALLALQHTNLSVPSDTNIEPLDNEISTVSPKEKCDAAVNTITETVTRDTQTTFVCNELLASKINRIVEQCSAEKVVKQTSFEDQFSHGNIAKDEKKFRFYTGLTLLQYMHLFSSFGKEPEQLNYWRGSKTTATLSRKTSERKVSPVNQLFMTLIKLRPSQIKTLLIVLVLVSALY